ncbi:MAG: SpoIIE family protein phosphatase [Blastocatellia bacterium]|nr:SpoIIE family protein phosphatase [Blastocatellia bacterium]MCX7751583.1 SpoIIE family protein phosphatase [Blastocatellia bacterium]MDW8168683.1 SpoIIE family protein phosphatase [Acidobacteriota bacterium]
MLKLLVRTPGHPPVTFEVTKRRIAIGRSAHNDLCLEDPFASRVHAELRCEGQTYWLTDLGSANGTYVNGVRIRETVPIAPGDRLQIGETILEVLSGVDVPSRVTSLAGESAREIVARPEMAISSGERPPLAPEVHSVMDSIRAVSAHLAPEVEQSRKLLAVVSQVGVALLSSLSLEEVLKQIVGLVLEAVPAERAFLLLQNAQGELVCKVACYRGQEPSEVERVVRISRSITEEVVGRGRSVLTSDAQVDERFRQRDSILLSGIRSIMAVPLLVNRREVSPASRQIIGMIYVDNPMSAGVFTEWDLQLLTMVASVAAIKIENTLLLEQRLENERIKQQLAQARDLQLQLLPITPPEVPGYDLTGISFPCYEVGGDYFDFICVPDGELVFALGDVSGKGMDAAILMSALHASVRAQALTVASVAEMAAAVNRYLVETTAPNKFATLWLGRLNPRTHELRYVNAGHNPPLLMRAHGEVEFLEEGGIPVGILGEVAYEEGSLRLEPGDVLVLFSDGISESTNEQGEEFGVARLVEVVRRHRELRAASLRDRIEEALSLFVGKRRPADDMTLLILKRTA